MSDTVLKENVQVINEDENVINERDVMLECCGEDADRNAKAVTVVHMGKYNVLNGEEVESCDDIVMDEPIINIYRSIRTTMVDLTFMPNSFNLVNVVGRMQEFIKASNMENDDNLVMPSIVLTISPKTYMGMFYCTGMHASWVVMPSKIGYPADTIRFTFPNDSFGIFQVDNPQGGENEST